MLHHCSHNMVNDPTLLPAPNDSCPTEAKVIVLLKMHPPLVGDLCPPASPISRPLASPKMLVLVRLSSLLGRAEADYLGPPRDKDVQVFKPEWRRAGNIIFITCNAPLLNREPNRAPILV